MRDFLFKVKTFLVKLGSSLSFFLVAGLVLGLIYFRRLRMHLKGTPDDY